MYYINSTGQQTLEVKKNGAIKIFFVVMPLFLLLGFALYIAWQEFIIAFYAVLLPVLIVNEAIGFFAARRSLVKCASTIVEIERNEDKLYLLTFDSFFFFEKRMQVPINTIIISNGSYDWYVRRKSIKGVTITIDKTLFYLVSDFFDEFDEIVKAIK